MSGAWPRKKVSEIAKHSLGKMLDRSKNKGDLKPYLRNQNVRWFDFDLSDVSEMRFLPEELAKYTVSKGDVVVCEGGYPGRAAIWDQDKPIYFQKALHRVRFSEPDRNKWFLYYLLSRDLDGTLKQHFNGAGIQHFTGEALAQFELPVPPLAEQRRIVSILDEAFEGIAAAKVNAEQNLCNVRELYQNHLQSVFTQRGPGWAEKRLGELSRIKYGYTDSASAQIVGPQFLRITDLQPSGVDWDTVPYCSIDKTDLPKYRLADGDIVFARTGATTGKSHLVTNPPEAVFASYLIRVQLRDKAVQPKFVNMFFQTRSYWDAIRAGVSGSAQGGFNATKLGDLVIPFPESPSDQTSLVAKLDELAADIKRLANLYERKLQALDALKRSLLHQAFAGQL
ncbi:MAG: restriction endonuclease subunit S [Gemmatimonadaceae bacterium]|nr:restriction endonuclease subunit S [Gemmatimonadaceae bacterium]